MAIHQQLGSSFAGAHPEDAARILEGSSPQDVAAFLPEIPAEVAAALLARMQLSFAADCLSLVEGERAAEIGERLRLDRAALLLRRMDDPDAERILGTLSEDRARRLRALMRYPEGTAAAIADPEVATLTPDITVGTARKRLERSRPHVHPNLYVIDRDGRLVGVLGAGALLQARAGDRVESLMRADVITVSAHTDVGALAVHPAWRELDALPVVDRTGLFLGVVRHRRIRQLLDSNRRDDESGLAVLAMMADLYWISLSSLVSGMGEMVGPTAHTRQTRGRR